ncbi:hypothetical protein [Bacteroides sp.]|uniref:hypothetical protein n=1 Tax=Bacteroides sp. TaxID=29523 RepID=UPI001B6B982A|nr:hypothetical protein [Bacteroides sp.]MBP6936133.1 hypothetical protein [Bacteroides sp.]MBP9585583.1 hypothetical protein [Bacteroides sp.]
MEKINKYIKEEKAMSPSPFLGSRILAQIENLEAEQIRTPGEVKLWQSMAVAVGIAIVATLGITIGNTYKHHSTPDYSGLIVNDDYIEQFSIYTADENK